MSEVKRAWRQALVVVGVLVLVVAAGTWAFRRVGTWLIVEDRLEPAQAIVVLSGRMPQRALEAAELYRQGYAAEVWVMQPSGPGEKLEPMGIPFVGEEFYSQKVLLAKGVPADAIRVPEQTVQNTEDEVRVIAAEMGRVGGGKVIVVTSRAHTRRVKAIWRRVVGENPRAMVHGTPGDGFDAEHWWRSTYDALDVVREMLGLANVWAGFPLRPTEKNGLATDAHR